MDLKTSIPTEVNINNDLKTQDKEHQLPTHNIANKGFSGMRKFLARYNFSCNLIGNHLQSLTGHIVNRVCLESTNASWLNAVQKMEALTR